MCVRPDQATLLTIATALTRADVKGYPESFGLFRMLDGWHWDVAYLVVVLSGIAGDAHRHHVFLARDDRR